MATYDGKKLSIYLNGALSGSVPAGGTCPNDKPVYVGNDGANPQPWYALGGALDELTVYRRALSASEVHEMYVYQGGWVEDRESRSLTVDADNPTAEVLVADPPYQANWPAQVLVKAGDATSGVEKVQLCVGSGDCSAAPVASHCVDLASASAWCPTFSPTGQGVYSLSARATDRVGHTATSAAKPVYVDDSAPTLSLAAPANGSWYTATEYQGKSNTWAVHFSGAVYDPALSGSVAGSGVPPDGVEVTLYRSDGGLVGTGPQTAAVTGGAWALDYLFGDADPSGCYKAVVEAVDRVARTSGLSDAQVARHTTVVEQQISVDADAGVASVDWTNQPAGQLGPAATMLGGAASSRPVPVVLTFTGGSNSAQTSLVLACQHGNKGSWWQPYSTEGATLAPGQAYTWGQDDKPTIHRGSSCQVQLATSAPSDDLSGSVTVCGQEVLSWSGSFKGPGRTLSFTADSTGCRGGNGCPAGVQKATAGVKGVDVSFLPVTPGSPFTNETPPAGEALHLTMDSDLDGSGNPTFPDVSASRLSGACSGTTCPVAGQQGHSGRAALFDGVDDAVTFPNFGAFTRVTASAWVRPASATAGQQTILSYKAAQGCGFRLFTECDGEQCIPYFQMQVDLATLKRQFITVIMSPPVPLGMWAHVAATYDGASIRVYRDGQEVNYGGSQGTMVQCAPGGVAAAVGSDELNQRSFAGMIDEVRVFDHALTADEIKILLYTGSGPVLVLPFEKQWAADGSEQEDASGWQYNAVLYTGSGDSGGKAVTGQAGRYALHYDGVDDYAVVPDNDAIDFDTVHDFAIAAWIKPDPAQAWTQTVDNNVIEKWSGAGGYPYSIRYLNQTAGVNAGKISGGRWDGQNGPWLQSTTRIDDGRFHHVALVKSGSTLAFYVDGTQQGQRTDTTTGATANTSPLYIGRRGGMALQGYFTRSVDDVRIYPRALAAPEIQALFLSGWQPPP
jgi:hypothetical protein